MIVQLAGNHNLIELNGREINFSLSSRLDWVDEKADNSGTVTSLNNNAVAGLLAALRMRLWPCLFSLPHLLLPSPEAHSDHPPRLEHS
jgi:hypothetical protein